MTHRSSDTKNSLELTWLPPASWTGQVQVGDIDSFKHANYLSYATCFYLVLLQAYRSFFLSGIMFSLMVGFSLPHKVIVLL